VIPDNATALSMKAAGNRNALAVTEDPV